MRANPLLDRLPTYPTVLLDQAVARLRAEGRPVYDFGTGDPTEPTPAFIREAMLGAVPDNCRYPTIRGGRAVRAAFAGYARRRFGVELDPDREILPTSGSKEVVFHLPLLSIDAHAPDRGVLFPDPGYSVCHRGALLAGGEPIPLVLGGDFGQRIWEVPPDVLARTRLAWINSPHNPTGSVMTREDLRRTVEVCREHDILLASDECYADVWFDAPPPSVLEVAREGVLAVFSLSKRSGMTGYRTGIVAGDPAVIAKLHHLRTNPGLAPQDFVNAAATAAWGDDAHAEARRGIFAEKRAILMRFLAERGIEVVASQAGFYLWLRVPAGFDGPQGPGVAYAQHLLRAGIVVNPGGAFALTNCADSFVRLALVPGAAECRAAVEAWRTLEG